MARKGNTPDNPGKLDTEQESGTRRRYQSPQTPPQAPRTQAGRDEGDREARDFDGEDSGEIRRGQQQQGRQGGQQDWQGDSEMKGDGGSSGFAGRGSDFDLQKASRDELNAIARELNIEDFETMNREELVMEIRERS